MRNRRRQHKLATTQVIKSAFDNIFNRIKYIVAYTIRYIHRAPGPSVMISALDPTSVHQYDFLIFTVMPKLPIYQNLSR